MYRQRNIKKQTTHNKLKIYIDNSRYHACSFGSQQLPGFKTEHEDTKNALKRGSLLTLDSMLIRGAKVGGVGGVATPPEFWKGGLNPPLIFRKICVEIMKIRLFCVKFLKVGLF